LNDKIKMAAVSEAVGMCPTQWEGETEFKVPIYIRYRGGRLSIWVDDELFQMYEVGGKYDGRMDTRDMMTITSDWLDWSRAKVDPDFVPAYMRGE
jgi:hypothetical protein